MYKFLTNLSYINFFIFYNIVKYDKIIFNIFFNISK